MSDDPRIDGVILAAGQSTRMTRPKPLLRVGGGSFLDHAAEVLKAAGCERTWVVANPDADWLDRAAELGLDVVFNPRPSSEQIDSLRLALRRLPDEVAAVMVLPIDVPLVTGATTRAVAESYRAAPAPLVLPFHNGVAGHPVLLGRAVFDEVLHGELDEGVRSLILAHASDLREVPVTDRGILIDIDTPDDYRRHIRQT
jgi:molybdenum cofactor cytidylyltransferase